MRILLIAPALALSLACVAPAQAATEGACREVFAKMSANGKSVTDKRYVAMMKKSGRKMASSSRISKNEFMMACYADVFERSSSG
jgi:hypothetical protein